MQLKINNSEQWVGSANVRMLKFRLFCTFPFYLYFRMKRKTVKFYPHFEVGNGQWVMGDG